MYSIPISPSNVTGINTNKLTTAIAGTTDPVSPYCSDKDLAVVNVNSTAMIDIVAGTTTAPNSVNPVKGIPNNLFVKPFSPIITLLIKTKNEPTIITGKIAINPSLIAVR